MGNKKDVAIKAKQKKQFDIRGAFKKPALAALAGVSDVAFRELCKGFGAGVTFSEMVSAKAVWYGYKSGKHFKTLDLLKTSDTEDIKGVQIFGSDADIISEIVGYDIFDKYDIIDVNMGCPMPKIVNNGDGGALIKKENWDKAKNILTRLVKATKKPVTIKTRAGFNSNTAVEFAKMARDCGIAAISVHPRTVQQLYKGRADWGVIKAVKATLDIPVFARGDIFSAQAYFDVLDQTGADGAFIARGSFGNPFIFAEISAVQNCSPTNNSPFATKIKDSPNPTKKETSPKLLKDNPVPATLLKDTILQHIDLSLKHFGERYTVLTMRKHILWYFAKASLPKKLKAQATTLNCTNQLKDFIVSTL
ncbi:MAG: tRNA-dihydrouridine synthase [Firmicutes bacterium]|nr:tRNA-dihydrouridine synthase [Bacillota bacterium]